MVTMTTKLKFMVAFVMALVAGSVSAGAIHTWATSDTVTATDVNGNFQHIHNLMVGGHGGRLVDADVSGSANIASSKLAAFRAIPRAWALVGVSGTACTSGTCTLGASYNVTSVAHTSTGVYTVTLAYTPADGSYAVLATAMDNSANDGYCSLRSIGSTPFTTFTVVCRYANGSGTGVLDTPVSFMVLDNN